MFEGWTYNKETGQLYSKRGPVGYVNGNGYVEVYYQGKKYRAHRVAWYLVYNTWPPEDIDHIDTNRANNCWSNLRLASDSQNLRNQKKIKGYHLHKLTGKWRAQYSLDNKVYHIGLFDTEAEAEAAYIATIKSIGQEVYHLRP